MLQFNLYRISDFQADADIPVSFKYRRIDLVTGGDVVVCWNDCFLNLFQRIPVSELNPVSVGKAVGGSVILGCGD